MTKKEYKIVAWGFAEELRRLLAEQEVGMDRINHMVGVRLAARSVAEELAEANERFDTKAFLKSCGIGV